MRGVNTSMKKKGIILISLIILISISGCNNKTINSFKEEKELLTKEIVKLQELISVKDKEINNLKDSISKITTERNELKESLKMSRFSSYSRLNDYNDSFDNLIDVYKISSKYTIKDDWYVLNEDYFHIELLGYENAKKVDFYTLRMESGEGPILLFSDNDPSDGWVFKYDNVSEIIDKQIKASPGNFSYVAYFLIYTEVTLEDGNIIRTPKLPVYNE